MIGYAQIPFVRLVVDLSYNLLYGKYTRALKSWRLVKPVHHITWPENDNMKKKLNTKVDVQQVGSNPVPWKTALRESDDCNDTGNVFLL